MSVSDSWNVPDWRDAQNYRMPPVDEMFMRALAWEFLRRNWDYRNWWEEKVAPFMQDDGTLSQSFEPLIDEDGGGLDRSDLIIADVQSRFGLQAAFPLSPRQTPGHVSFEAAAVMRLSKAGAHSLEDWEIGYVFDMRLPLDGQFAQALDKAKDIQALRAARGLFDFEDGRTGPDLYLVYLRILDAYDAGAKTKKIADILFPLETSRVERLKKLRKRARYLRDEGFRKLGYLTMAEGAAVAA